MKTRKHGRPPVVLLLCGFALILISGGCSLIMKPPPVGDQPPVIEACWASPDIYSRQVWKLYVKAHDPDGDMWEARFRLDQPGVIHNEFDGDVRLSKAHEERIDGYFYLRDDPAPWETGFVDVTVTFWLEDRGGRRSEVVSLPLSIGRRAPQSPPPGFTERPLLPIPYQIERGSDSARNPLKRSFFHLEYEPFSSYVD